MGLCRVSSFIGGVPSLFHRKLLIFLTSALSTSLGIPWTFVRYCVIPAMVIWIINFLPSIVGWLFDHWVRLLSILSRVLDHIPCWSALFPTHAPRMRVGSPSFVMWMSWGMQT